MTISYTTTRKHGGFFQLLFQWKGSIWKLILKQLLLFIAIYAILSLLFRHALTESQKMAYRHVSNYFDKATTRIPITFLLGFYVNHMVSRWWQQWESIFWPDRFMIFLTATLRGTDEKLRLVRRTIARYINLTAVIVWRMVSLRIIKRFPENEHLVKAGLMTPNEKKVFEEMDAPYGNYFAPIVWSANMLSECKEQGYIDSIQLDRLLDELNGIRGVCGTMLGYDWVSIPLVYTQVATIATYGYLIFCLLGRLPSDSYDPDHSLTPHLVNASDPHSGITGPPFDLYVPLFTLLEFVFYMGWLSVAEELCNPFGQDDEDFEMNWILDRNVQIGYMIGDALHGKVAGYEQDMFWDAAQPKMHHTVASYKIKENEPLGHFTDFHLRPGEETILEGMPDHEIKRILRKHEKGMEKFIHTIIPQKDIKPPRGTPKEAAKENVEKF